MPLGGLLGHHCCVLIQQCIERHAQPTSLNLLLEGVVGAGGTVSASLVKPAIGLLHRLPRLHHDELGWSGSQESHELGQLYADHVVVLPTICLPGLAPSCEEDLKQQPKHFFA